MTVIVVVPFEETSAVGLCILETAAAVGEVGLPLEGPEMRCCSADRQCSRGAAVRLGDPGIGQEVSPAAITVPGRRFRPRRAPFPPALTPNLPVGGPPQPEGREAGAKARDRSEQGG